MIMKNCLYMDTESWLGRLNFKKSLSIGTETTSNVIISL